MTLPEVGHAYTRAQALCQQVGEPVQHCQTLWSVVFVANVTTLFAQYRRDAAATAAGADGLMAAAAAQGFGRRVSS